MQHFAHSAVVASADFSWMMVALENVVRVGCSCFSIACACLCTFRDPPLTSFRSDESSRPQPLCVCGGGGSPAKTKPLSVYLPPPGALPLAQGCCIWVSHWWWMSWNATSDRYVPRVLCGLRLCLSPAHPRSGCNETKVFFCMEKI